MGWNGQDLVNEYSALLGDQSAAFKSKVEGWLQDVEREICKAHTWSFLKLKGSKIMTLSQEEQSLIIDAPSAASLAVVAGGSLTADTAYYLKISFYDPISKNEKIGVISSAGTTTSVNKQINVTSIPLSTESFFTQRRVYLRKGTGPFYLYSTIADNTTVTATISADTTSKIQAPDFDYFRQIDGCPFYESSFGQLRYLPVDQIRLLFNGQITSGQPEAWGELDIGKILMYPSPNAVTALKFYFYKIPRGIYNDSGSIPTIPISLKEVLEAGVEYKGYKYRDRAGVAEKANIYKMKTKEAIDSLGKSNVKVISIVRDTQGLSSGRSLNSH